MSFSDLVLAVPCFVIFQGSLCDVSFCSAIYFFAVILLTRPVIWISWPLRLCVSALKKLGAARAVFNKIPAGSIDVVIKNWQMQVNGSVSRGAITLLWPVGVKYIQIPGLPTVTEFQYFVKEMRTWVRKFFWILAQNTGIFCYFP